MALKVGFIGLGIMGQPMAQNVVKGGHALTVYNRSSEKARPFGDAGATVASTPKAVAEASDVTILMLAGPMGCALFEFKKPMLIDDSFSAQFPLKHMTKDIRFALQTADENGAMAPIGHTVFQL